MKLVVLGAVTRAHGVRGDVEVVAFHPKSPFWREDACLWVIPGDDPVTREREADFLVSDRAEEDAIVRVRPGAKGRLVLTLARCRDRRTAEALRGAVLGVPPESLGDLESDEFWFHEVAGWKVWSVDGEAVGTVIRAVDLTTQLFEVRPEGGGETFFVPIVDHVVEEIDREAGRVTIHLVEGLLP
jgi:16S rRNA processing protein RimM